jgi:hypothetical protein
MAEAMAWIVPLDANLCIAMGEHEMVHFVEHPVCENIPAYPWSAPVLLWALCAGRNGQRGHHNTGPCYALAYPRRSGSKTSRSVNYLYSHPAGNRWPFPASGTMVILSRLWICLLSSPTPWPHIDAEDLLDPFSGWQG